MKLEKILEKLNSLEKGPFLKVINNLCAAEKNNERLEEILLNTADSNLKNADGVQVAQAFDAVSDAYVSLIMDEYTKASSQLDILINLITRDGNCIMRLDWFAKLYEDEVKRQKKAIELFKENVHADKPTIDESRIRDYKVYAACLRTAYFNDKEANFTPKITADEQSILNTLAQLLELSQDEMTMLKYSVLGITKNSNIEEVVSELREKGLILLSKKTNTIYVADEVVSLARKICGKQIADKHYRRILLSMKEFMVNAVCRKHGIDTKLTMREKVEYIISTGVSFTSVMTEDIYKSDMKLPERKKFFAEFCEERLGLGQPLRGVTLDDKVASLIAYYDKLFREEKIGISAGGYDRMLADLGEFVPDANKVIRTVFQIQDDNALIGASLTDYNIMPRDILELFTSEELMELCTAKGIRQKGSLVENILAAYKDNENLLVENYENIGFRNINTLRENGVNLTEAELGIVFEDVTKYILTGMGLDVDEKLRKKLNTDKDKMDILLRTGDTSVVLVECKTSKDNGYNKFSAVSRQVRSYKTLLEKNGYNVDRIIIVAPDFSDEFVADCGDEYTLPITLLKSASLSAIYKTVKEVGTNKFNLQMFYRDIAVQEDRIIRILKK